MISLRFHSALLAAAALCAAQTAAVDAVDGVWKSKPPAEWTAEDATQVLTASPWVRLVKAGVARRETEDQLREGGRMGQLTGVGNENIDPKGSGPQVSLNPFKGPVGGNDRSVRSRPGTIVLKLAWESAPPVQLAELKLPAFDAPTIEGDGYKIAVYGVPDANFADNPEKLGEPLKRDAALKREGRQDVGPVRVEVLRKKSGIVVVYLFPMSAEISERDGDVEFAAQMGRISVDHTFHLSDMKFLGQLTL